MTPDEIRELRQAATNIVARQKQLEEQHNRLADELAKVKNSAHQAKLVADQARKDGDDARAAQFDESAEILNQKVVDIDTEMAAITGEMIESRQASDEAKTLASNSAIEMTELKAQGERASAAFAGDETAAFEQDVQKAEAATRLAQIRAEMGLTDNPEPVDENQAPPEDG